MSHQSSELPIVEEAGSRTAGKKTKGTFEVWISYGRVKPHKWRSYKTRERADENAKDFERKWNRGSNDPEPFFKFEVRPKE
jgi:hypothetical protein